MTTGDLSDYSEEDLWNKFILGDFDKFKKYVKQGEQLVKEALKYIPEAAYSSIRGILLKLILESGKEDIKPRMKVVVDSNVIISEAFRVGRGKSSSTVRIFNSPVVDIYAPKIIREEVTAQIRTDLPKGCSIDIALKWANSLLDRVHILDKIGSSSIEKAKQRLDPQKFGKDCLFLGVAMESGSSAIISNDAEAFGAVQEIQRWEVGRLVDLVLVREGGYVSLFIFSGSLEVTVRISQYLVLVIGNILLEIGKVVATIASGIIEGGIKLIQNVPAWAFAVIGIVGVTLLIYFLTDKDRRESLSNAMGEFGEFISEVISTVVKALKAYVEVLWKAMISIAVFIIPFLNFLVIAAGVMMGFMREVINEIKENKAPI